MDKVSREKIRNYFSDRIEEIKEGTFIPSYDQIKDLPEFSGIKRDAFRIARKKWYKQNLHASFYEFSSRFDKEYEKKYLKEKRNNGLCCLIPGVIFIVFFTFSLLGVLGTVFLVIGIILIWIIHNSKRNKTFGLSEEEYVQMQKKQIKGKRNNGLCFLIPGAIIFIWALYFGISMNWPGSMAAIAWAYGIPFGIILMVIGILLIIYYSIKGERNRALMAIIIGDISFLIPGVIIIVVGITWFAENGNWLIFTMVGIIFLVLGIILIRNYNKKHVNYL